MIQEKIPNLFRLYLNPFVVQTCLCLSKYAQRICSDGVPADRPYQTFLANSFYEALSGAIKLARYANSLKGLPRTGLVIDPRGRLGHFASVNLDGGGKIDFVPGLRIAEEHSELDALQSHGERYGFLVLVGPLNSSMAHSLNAMPALNDEKGTLTIACVDRPGLAAWLGSSGGSLQWKPDIVVFDESFVNRDVPFAAFTARRDLFDHWNSIAQGAFHSTTYQPNSIASLHFIQCLAHGDPEFYAAVLPELKSIERDPDVCMSLLRDLYSPFLAKAISTLRLDVLDVKACGHYVTAGGQRIFDGVAGVACSVRGHNSPAHVREIEELDEEQDCEHQVTALLSDATGLEHVVPAVSGASAVENALRIALTAQFPRRHVLAFQGGFGGKTLLALAGTAKEFYRAHVDPLYENVIYVDPRSPTVLEDVEAVLREYPVAVVQLELIQAVGGIRLMPAHLLRYLQENKARWGYLLFVDEVQTGFYRTGSLTLSDRLGICPDILTLGKGTSDMMFPFALTLYSSAIQNRLDAAQPELTTAIRKELGYEWGWKSVFNVLRFAEKVGLQKQVEEASALFSELLRSRLMSCKNVRDVRVHGLLIGIECDTARWPNRWLGKRASSLYLLRMLRDRLFPLLIGYCQYEPHVLKLTPPLTVTPDEVRRICDTIATAVNGSSVRLFATAAVALAKSFLRRNTKERRNSQ
jgi:acetylornithine/succinyldiaminopimelate/putrescine aminotransferase